VRDLTCVCVCGGGGLLGFGLIRNHIGTKNYAYLKLCLQMKVYLTDKFSLYKLKMAII
jgi:hypothetical protein